MIKPTTYLLSMLLIWSACSTNNKAPQSESMGEDAVSTEAVAQNPDSPSPTVADQPEKENIPAERVSSFYFTSDSSRLVIYRSADDSLIFSDDFTGEVSYRAGQKSTKDADLFTIYLETQNDTFIIVCDQATGSVLLDFHTTGEESSYYTDYRDVSRSASQQLLKMEFYTSATHSELIFQLDTKELIAKLCSFGGASWAGDDTLVYMDCANYYEVDSLPKLELYHAYFFEKKWLRDTTWLTGKYISSYVE